MNQTSAKGRRLDAGFIAITGLVALISIWLLLTPCVPSIASATMRRFHLSSSSFLAWAIQFPIPAMYNFANQYEVRQLPPGLVDPILEESEKRHLNHFPARVLTFADNRYFLLHDGKDRWVTIETSYRGQQIETAMHARPTENGQGFELVRLGERESSR